VRAPLPDDYALDGRLAARAGFARAAEHLQFVAVAAASPADGIKIGLAGTQRCAEVFQPALEHFSDCRMQDLGLLRHKRIGTPARMDPSFPQSLVGVNVSKAGDKTLVYQQRLYQAAACLKAFEEHAGGKFRIERFRSESPQDALGVMSQIDTSELAGIVEPQLAAVREGQHHMFVGKPLRFGRDQMEAARHAQMHEQMPAAGQIHHQELPAPADGDNLFFFDPAAELRGGRLGDRPGPVDRAQANVLPTMPAA